jgi:hypothetical protein
MKTKLRLWLIFLISTLCGSIAAAVEIHGTVSDATQDTATIAIEGDSVPNVGDAVEIYFKAPGADEEVSVGNGKVTAISADSVEAKIDNPTGTLAKDQQARITSENPQPRSAVTAATPSGTSPTEVPSPPPPTPAAGSQSSPTNRSGPATTGDLKQQFLGTWQSPKHRLTFLADGTYLVDPKPGAKGTIAHWHVAGDQVITTSPQGKIEVYKVESTNPGDIVLRNEKGTISHLARIPDATR